MKKKGFTLIELLAVIVVLAIIALIATPMVLNTIEKAREGAAKASAETYMRAIEEYMVKSQLDVTKPQLQAGVKYQLSSKKYEVASIANPNEVFINDLIDIKGDKPESGYVIVTTSGTVDKMEMVMKDYPVTCSNDSCEVTEETEKKESYEAYAVGDAVTIDGIGYHVTKASGTSDEYVTLLRDESIGNFFFDENYGTDYETSTLKTYLDTTYKATFGEKESLIQEVTLLETGEYESYVDEEAGYTNVRLNDSDEGTFVYLFKNYESIFFPVADEFPPSGLTLTKNLTFSIVKNIIDNNYVHIDVFTTGTSTDQDGNTFYTDCGIGGSGCTASSSEKPVRPVVVISKKALDETTMYIGDVVTLNIGSDTTSEWNIVAVDGDTVKLLKSEYLIVNPDMSMGLGNAQFYNYDNYTNSNGDYTTLSYENSHAKDVVDEYGSTLNLGDNLIDIGLITINELETLGCDINNSTCANVASWIHGIGWTSSVSDATAGEIWQVITDGTIISENGTADGFDHLPILRPVITVPLTAIQ